MRELPPIKQHNNHKPPYSITLQLNDIHDLFALPRHNPFREDYLPVSGIDQLALRLRKARLENGLNVTFLLPVPVEQEPDLHADVQAAITRYCKTRLDNLLFELKARQLTVIRSLEVGLIILGATLGLAAAISRSEGIVEWLRTLLANAISIFGSVALWSPADAFLFGIRPLYNDLHTYHAIRDMTFDIQYEQLDSNPLVASTSIGKVTA
ncbi:MAG: hypothetical protein H0X30_10820 [Anaerolineae bacterium]|nr:hypothetical protein [Anaerolineae bacterium]